MDTKLDRLSYIIPTQMPLSLDCARIDWLVFYYPLINIVRYAKAGSAAELHYFQLCLECLDEELLDHNLTQLLGSRTGSGVAGTTYIGGGEMLRQALARNAEYVTTIKLLIL